MAAACSIARVPVMVPTGQDSNLLFLTLIDKPMLRVDAPGPTALQFMLERFGLFNAFERIALNLSRMILGACARFCSTHHARSSNAAASNSKLLNDRLDREPFVALLGLEQTPLHGVGLRQIGRLLLRFDLPQRESGTITAVVWPFTSEMY